MEQLGRNRVEASYVNIDGTRIRYLHAGEEGSPVILLHGGGVDAAHLSWKHVLAPLSTNHRVFAPDFPGYGASDAPDVAYSTSYFVEFLEDFLDRLDLNEVALVGLSMGGAVALALALRAPGRVDKLALVDSYGLADESPRGVRALTSPLAWQAMRHNRSLVRWGLRRLVHDESAITDELVAEAHDLVARPHAGRAARRFWRREVGHRGVESDFSGQLGSVELPTLVVHGTEDQVVPVEWAIRAHEHIPDARLVTIEGCGHWSPIERPSAVNRALDSFLADE